MDSVLERMKEDMRVRDLASATQRSYIKYVGDYLAYFGRSPELLDSTHVREFQLHLRTKSNFRGEHLMPRCVHSGSFTA